MNQCRLNDLLLQAKMQDMTKAEKLELTGMLSKMRDRKPQAANLRVICCPFHDEETPSCSINFTTNVIHCFGCGISGKMEFNKMPALVNYKDDISKLELSLRSENPLRADGVHRVGDLCVRSRDELLKTPNLGRKSVTEIEDCLVPYNLRLSEG